MSQSDSVDGDQGCKPTQTRAVDEIPISEMKETPLQMKQVIALFFVLLSEGMCSSMLLPFVGLYVSHLRGNANPNTAGYFSGFLIGCFMLGQVVSARMWGWLSDQYGRRFPLVSGLLMNGLSMMGFGLSSNIWMCIFFRFMHGLFNGNVLVAKTMMSDITDRTNISRGFSYVSLCFTFGFSIGPVMGGLLYDPCENLGFSKGGVFEHYPALLPSLFIYVYTLIGFVIVCLFVKESNPHAKPLPRWLQLITPCLAIQTDVFVPHPNPTLEELQAAERTAEDEREFDNFSFGSLREDYLTQSGFVDHPMESDFVVDTQCVQDDAVVKPAPHDENEGAEQDSADSSAAVEAKPPFGYRAAFKEPVLRMVLIQYMFMSSAELIMKECFPLFGIASHDVRGLELSSKQISVCLLINSIPCFVANVLFPRIMKRYSNQIAVLRLGSAVAAVFMVLFTLPPMFSGSTTVVVVFMMIFMCLGSFFAVFCFSVNSVITTKAAPPGHIGATMGIMQSCGAIVRMITPFVVTPIFAFTVSGRHIYPFNYAFVFLISASFYGFLWWRSYSLRTTPTGILERT